MIAVVHFLYDKPVVVGCGVVAIFAFEHLMFWRPRSARSLLRLDLIATDLLLLWLEERIGGTNSDVDTLRHPMG